MSLQMTLSNWQCHRSLELDLAGGVHLVLAANMAGKTALRDAVEFVLAGTGVLRGIKTKKDLALYSIYEDERECSVELLLKGPAGSSPAGPERTVYAIRSMNRTGGQELIVGNEAGRVETEKLGDAQATLWKLLDLDADRLRLILGAEDFFRLAPNERRELVSTLLAEVVVESEELIDQLSRRGIESADAAAFAKLVGGHGWRAAEETAIRRRADAKGMIKAMGDPTPPDPVYDPPWRKEPLDLSTILLDEMEERLRAYRETEARQRESAAEGRGAIEARLQATEREFQDVAQEIADLELRESPIEPLQEEIARDEEAYRAARSKCDVLSEGLDALREEAEALDAEEFERPDPCPVIPGGPACPMTPKKMEAHQATVAARLSETSKRIEDLEPELEQQREIRDLAEGRLEEVRRKVEEQATIDARLAELRPRVSELEGEVERESGALADAKDEPAGEGDFLSNRIEQGEKTIRAKIAYDEAAARYATYGETEKGHQKDRDRWDRVAKALAPDGIEAGYADRYLAPVRDAIERFGKRFGGMRLDRDYNVELLWEERWRRWHQLSESGRVRVGYAIQYAFASLTGFRLLLLDQLDHLDADGKLAAIETLRDLSGEFDALLGLATLQRAEPTKPPFEDVSAWHLAGPAIRRVE